ncbi:hypothetical protein RIF29_17964 [Crotalaria pallida]|uniref:Uncharacterized protein n=1 Tax=Crotalaria pallida TaxID=3830 RepID=A0AAN9IDG0_CROPI
MLLVWSKVVDPENVTGPGDSEKPKTLNPLSACGEVKCVSAKAKPFKQYYNTILPLPSFHSFPFPLSLFYEEKRETRAL